MKGGEERERGEREGRGSQGTKLGILALVL